MIRTFCYTAVAIVFGSTTALAQTGYYQPNPNPYLVPPRAAAGQMGDYSTGAIPARNVAMAAPTAPMMNAAATGQQGAGCASYAGGGCAGYAAPAGGCDSYAGGCAGYGAGGCGAGGCGVGGDFFGGGCGDRYISLFGGWVNYYDTSFDFEVAGQFNGSGQLELVDNDGWAIGSAFGRRVGCNWRTEVEFAYRDNTLDSAQLSFTGGTAAPVFVEEDIDGRIRMYTGMYNVYRDLGQQCGKLRPYVGGGVGVAFIDAEASTASLGGIAAALDESAFAWQAMIGASMQVSCRAEMFAEYRIVGTDDEEISIASGALGATASAEFETMSNNVLFGIRINR